MTLTEHLGLKGNPFEHYTAETEPNIAEYAVRPRYLQSISDRASGLSSFILFGDRGAGKSATRLTVYKDVWDSIATEDRGSEPKPFLVNLTDYSRLQQSFKRDKLTDKEIVSLTAFFVLEQMFAWLSSLEEGDREDFVEGLNKEESALTIALLQGFYLTVPEIDRTTSTSEALKLLGSAWTTQSKVWTLQRWTQLSTIFASVIQVFAKKEIDDQIDIKAPVEQILKSLVGESASAPRAILSKLVEFSQAFGFSGVCILVDKLDETSETSDSAEATARIIHPLLTHIQLLEVPGFSWILFLWSNVSEHFNGKLPVRLDKIANAQITWTPDNLLEMLNRRIKFYSNNTIAFDDIFESDIEPTKVFLALSTLSVKSPRELIKLMDILFREHDARGGEASPKIDLTTIELAQDIYAKETIENWYKKTVLQQLYRLGKTTFINKDVQSTFRIGGQGARNKITKWSDIGLVRQNGSIPGDSGGKPSFRYEIADPRAKRIVERRLDELVGVALNDEEKIKDEDFIVDDAEA